MMISGTGASRAAGQHIGRRASSRSALACQAAAGPAPQQSRRQALFASTSMLLLSAAPAFAARVERVCSDQDTGEEAAVCRSKALAADAAKQESYAAASTRKAGKGAYGVPVSVLDDAYGKATVELANRLDEYFTMDVYDRQRAPLIKTLKAESNVWVSKYARGGSVRKVSARKMYIAVDAVQGHLASSGLAPFPAAKQKTVNATIGEALTFLAEGK